MSRVIREVNENCDLHKALMNTGYAIRRKNYYIKGRYTGKVVDYYAPVYNQNEVTLGGVRDWSSEPRYVRGRGGRMYPAEFVEMFPYTYGSRY